MAQGYLDLRTKPQMILHNIFSRSAHYCIYAGRKRSPLPSVRFFAAHMRDELKQKFRGNKDLKNAKNPEDKRALHWLKIEMECILSATSGNTLVNKNPFRSKK